MTKINSSSIVTLQQEGSGCDSQPGIFLHEVWVQSTRVGFLWVPASSHSPKHECCVNWSL